MKLIRVAAACVPVALLSCALMPKPAYPAQVMSGANNEPSIRFGDAPELAYDADFFPEAQHNPAIATPDALLGQTHGSRLAHHAEVLAAFRLWAQQSDRVTVQTIGKTHEGRDLVIAVITSPANQQRIEELKGNLAKLANPVGLSDSAAKQMIQASPAVAWMGYSIHGDELSGTDASLAVGYHLVADESASTLEMLDDLVIVIDPCLNPDGRERIIGMVEQSAGYTSNLNYSSMHRGRWPHGRGNHYLFDMNRDWMAGIQPETRARWRAAQEWNPQLFVDAHEMGALDTFLFYPKANPVNPHIPAEHLEWQKVFASGAAQAFDREGWSYYTREWADGWAPFYSDAWAALSGAIGILYEQAGVSGFPLRRASGEVLTYREAVHHQVQASFANLQTLKENRVKLLESYLAAKRQNIAEDTPGNDEWLAVVPKDFSRMGELLRLLDGQGIEYFQSKAELSMGNARGARGGHQDSFSVPKGSLMVPARQARRPILRAYFEFDPRIDSKTLKEEREKLERENRSKMYDMTAWSIPHAFDIDAWWGQFDGESGDLEPGFKLVNTGGLQGADQAAANTYAWGIDGHDDSSVAFAARAMEAGLQVNISDRTFETGQIQWARGSLLIRRGEQSFSVVETERRIQRAAAASGATAKRILSGRAPGEGPDLGGGHFRLLARPRIALLANSPVSADTYGHLWHQLDVRLGVPFTIIDAQLFAHEDLRRYNVLILPPGGLGDLLKSNRDKLEAWVQAGGTLVAIGNSAGALAGGKLKLSSVSLRRNSLEKLAEFERAVARERAASQVKIDENAVWEGITPDKPQAAKAEPSKNDIPIKERDAWMRRFSPSGANLLADVDEKHWLTAGSSKQIAIGFSGSRVFLAKDPVQTAVRFTAAEHLRLAGLLWPEARERIASSAYLTREGRGKGQVILFAATPAFRGYHLGTGRLFSNAVIYGPGLGASQALGW